MRKVPVRNGCHRVSSDPSLIVLELRGADGEAMGFDERRDASALRSRLGSTKMDNGCGRLMRKSRHQPE